MNPQTLALIFGGVAVVILFAGVISALRPNREIEQRLERFAGQEQDIRPAKEIARERSSPIGDTLNRALAGRSFAEDLSTQLARADVKMTVGEFLALQVIMVVLGGVLGYILAPETIVFVLLMAVLGFFLPRILIGTAQRRRLKAFNNQLGDFLNLMVNGLRAGYSANQAMEAVATELPPPLSTEVGRVVQEMQIGLSMEQALSNMLRRVKSDDLDLIVTAMNVQREVGGNLAELLVTVAETMTERERLRRDVNALTAEGKISAIVLSVLPVGLGFFIYTVNPGYMDPLFEETLGKFLLGGSVLLALLGFWWMKKTIEIDI